MSSQFNVIMGFSSGQNITGSGSVYIGSNISPSYFACQNTLVGHEAMSDIGCENCYRGFTASFNTAVGFRAGNSVRNSEHNTYIGYLSVGTSSTSNSDCNRNNTFIGSLSAFNLRNGIDNTALGFRSGFWLNDENNRNTFIGANSGFTQSTTNVCNSIAIGVSASVWKSGQLSLGSNTSCINTGTTVSYSGSILSGTFSAALCVTINGTEYKIPLYL